MNKFVKFPLVLGIVGLVCTGALSLVYEVTKDTIAYNKNKEAIDKIQVVLPEITNAEPVLEKYDSAKASKKGIQNIYEVTDNTGVVAYSYLASAYGYKDGLTFLTVISAEDEVILGVQIVSNNETGNIGGALLKDEAFIQQFTNISFDSIYTDVDGKQGATMTLNGLINGLESVISFHKQELLGEEEVNDGVNLNGRERKALGLPEGYTMTDKTEEFKTTLKSKVSDNVYKKIMNDESIKILNYIDIKDASSTIKGHAYVAEGKYNCEVEHGNRAWQNHKFVIMFDENQANVQVVIVGSTDSMSAIDKVSISKNPWVSESFNGKTISELVTALENEEIDTISGATFTSSYVRDHVSFVIDAHTRAYGE